MRCDDLRLIQQWILQWRGSGATFEIVPVVTSKETRAVVAPFLGPSAARSRGRSARVGGRVDIVTDCVHASASAPVRTDFERKRSPMSLSLYQSSVPVFERSLTAFLAILDKAEAHAEARKFDPANYLAHAACPRHVSAHAAGPDLLRPRQERVVPARRRAGRRSSRTTRRRSPNCAPAFETTLDHLKTIDAKAIDAAADREIVFPIGPNRKVKMQGANYLVHFALPNFYFHLTTAYDILRSAGVEIGKRDFLGAVPGIVAGLKWKSDVMSITRLHAGPRMSQAVIHGDTIYLAGQVADQAKGKSVGEQTKDDPRDDRPAARRGRLRQDEDPVGDRSISPTSRPSPR